MNSFIFFARPNKEGKTDLLPKDQAVTHYFIIVLFFEEWLLLPFSWLKGILSSPASDRLHLSEAERTGFTQGLQLIDSWWLMELIPVLERFICLTGSCGRVQDWAIAGKQGMRINSIFREEW